VTGMSSRAKGSGRIALETLVLVPVHLYRLFVSPLLGPACRFEPSCSAYALDAVRAHGPGRGIWLTIKRLSRCRPGGGAGFDPVPPLAQYRLSDVEPLNQQTTRGSRPGADDPQIPDRATDGLSR
jgi:putative membrane protein insertion efficiency factor